MYPLIIINVTESYEIHPLMRLNIKQSIWSREYTPNYYDVFHDWYEAKKHSMICGKIEHYTVMCKSCVALYSEIATKDLLESSFAAAGLPDNLSVEHIDVYEAFIKWKYLL